MKNGSVIFDDLKSVCSEKIKHISQKIDENETYVDQHEREKGFEKLWLRVGLLSILAFIALLGFLNIPIRTSIHKILFGFL